MNDAMRQTDGLTIKAECGHPGVVPGAVCPYCGTTMPQKEKQDEEKH